MTASETCPPACGFVICDSVQVIVPDKWKEGASNVTEGGGRKVNENKLLSKKQRYTLLHSNRLAHAKNMKVIL